MRFPNFEPAITQVQRQLSLCRRSPGGLLGLQSMLLDGPPGIGKTAFANELAKALDMSLTRVSVFRFRRSVQTFRWLDSMRAASLQSQG